MMIFQNNKQLLHTYKIITAGSSYLDIDAYACMVAMAELLNLQGINAIAYSEAPCNYSVSSSLVREGQIARILPKNILVDSEKYIIVDVSDPDFLKDSIPLEKVIEVYDHHVGFENYWSSRIGEGAHIEFIGAAATLIYREWKKLGLQSKISHDIALLLIAAILDNTLNLTSANTTEEDVEAFRELCRREGVTDKWCVTYFAEVQDSIEADLKNAIFNDIKLVRDNPVLPLRVAQLCVWDAEKIILRLSEIRDMFSNITDSWMINIIDLQYSCSYFVCDSIVHQKKLEDVFDIKFEFGVAKTSKSYLRKEIIKKTLFNK